MVMRLSSHKVKHLGSRMSFEHDDVQPDIVTDFMAQENVDICYSLLYPLITPHQFAQASVKSGIPFYINVLSTWLLPNYITV